MHPEYSNQEVSRGSSPAGRALAGGFCSGLIGLLIAALCSHDEPPIRFPWLTIAGSSIVGAVFGVTLGAIQLRGRTRSIIVSSLVGTMIGLIAGASLFPMVMTDRDPHGNGPFRVKVFAAYQIVGVSIGVPLGAVMGGVVALIKIGITSHILRRRCKIPVRDETTTDCSQDAK